VIGKICLFAMPYFDARSQRNSFKARPCLVIFGPKNNDYTVLPLSTISRPENHDPYYDIELIPSKFPKLNLPQICYVRTHKQTVAHQGALYKELADMKSEYPSQYADIIKQVNKFNQEIQKENIKCTTNIKPETVK